MSAADMRKYMIYNNSTAYIAHVRNFTKQLDT